MAFKNLYELLKLKPTATPKDIAQAMKNAAQNQTISLDDLKQCKQLLLNEEARKKYNARLYAEYPEILIELTKPKEPEPTKLETPEPVNTVASKKKRYIFISVACAAVVAVMVGAYFKYYKPISDAKEAVKDILKDPDSAKFYNVKRFVNTKDKKVYVCGEVNAKVPAGGYGGKQRFVYFSGVKEAFLIPNEKPEQPEEELKYGLIYRVGCLDGDPVALAAQMLTTIKDIEEYRELSRKRSYTYNKIELADLDRKLGSLEVHMFNGARSVSIYRNSDDE